MSSTPTINQRIFEMLMESQYWPPEQMLAFQRNQLTQLLKHAKANTHFYKDRLDPVFKKNGDFDWNRWNEIPIVTRADLRDNRDEMLASILPPGHGPSKTFHSSGSSGVPVAVETTKIATDANRSASFRFWKNQGIDTAKTRASVSHYVENGDPVKNEIEIGKWGMPWGGSGYMGQNIFIDRSLPENRILQLLKSLNATYLRDIPNNADMLATANLHSPKPVKFEAVMCHGQGLTRDQRILFEESFGARSLSIYSSKESGLIGFQCGDGPHFHVNSETVLVEILTPEGKTCSPGEPGRVIVTPFFSTALPLIRYEQGDTAQMQLSCTCGNNLPVLSNVTGRQDQNLHLPDGMRTATGLSPKILGSNLNAIAFQIAQIAPLKLEVRYVPINSESRITPEPIIVHIHQIIHPRLEIIFKPLEKIPLNSGGKLQRIVCEIASQN